MLPSGQRSLHEVTQSAFISYALNRQGQTCFFEDLIRGDKYKSDIAYKFDQFVLVYEHDPLYWHPEDRDDCKKTQQLLAYPDVIVVRARIGASKLQMEHPRFIQLILPKSSKYCDTLKAFLYAVHERIPAFTFRFPDEENQKALISFAAEMYTIIHPSFDAKFSERAKLLADNDLKIPAEKLVRIPITTIRDSLSVLEKLGVSKEKIAKIPTLLTLDLKTLERKAAFLKDKLGLSKEKIAKSPHLLGSAPETLERKAAFLNGELDISKEKIAKSPNLLGSDPETLKRNAAFLKNKLGISKEKIATFPNLLGSDPKTLKRKAAFLKDVLDISKEKIAKSPILLTSNPKSLKRKAAFLKDEMGMKKENIAKSPNLLTSNPETLKRKVSWYDDKCIEWRNDTSLLTLNMDRIQESFEFLTQKCQIPQKLIGKKRLTRFKVLNRHRDQTNFTEFLSLGPIDKIKILDTCTAQSCAEKQGVEPNKRLARHF